jgi:hypothetical protein
VVVAFNGGVRRPGPHDVRLTHQVQVGVSGLSLDETFEDESGDRTLRKAMGQSRR